MVKEDERAFAHSVVGMQLEAEEADGVALLAQYVAGAQVEASRAVLFGLRADDILLSREPVEGVSARNRPRGRLLELVEDGTDVHARVELGAAGPELWVSLTPEATRELDLAPRVEVHLLIKTQSCHRLA